MTSSSELDSDDESEYIPTPLRPPKRHISPVKTTNPVTPCTLPRHCILLDLSQVEQLFNQINEARGCKTAGCRGKLVPQDIMTNGMGGTATIVYMCNGCQDMLVFQTSSMNTQIAKTDITLAAQVAFITAGCTYTTYAKALQDVLGIKAVTARTFMRTIETLHPIVENMVTEMCEREKDRMKQMDQTKLGSWKRAVTCADGTWMTRGFHSKNATFSIRNYFTVALLFYKHICQKGRDSIIDEELYQGTSKSAEGYSARVLFQTAKKEGLDIAIHWQDADSSSSKSVNDIYPDAQLMICGGHAGRAHLKKLQSLKTKRTFTERFKNMYRDKFPEVDTLKCACSKHKAGCGCLSDTFCQRARNNFSNILSDSQTATEFSKRLRALVYHVQDIHTWEGGQCEFHALKLCSCGQCEDRNHPRCQGKDYHTREVLSCPFHLLVYEIECHTRAEMANQLVHETLKRGHSNWLEGSHNVFIRFRPKHIFLERLHYHVATNLALLQANMTHEYDQQGAAYHWKMDLLQRLNLPVYDGVPEVLKKLNETRKKALDAMKSSKAKKRRVELKTLRTQEAQQRKVWSKKHGHDTYGDDEEDVIEEEVKPSKERVKEKTAIKKPCNRCGSTTHSRSTHRDCPYNKKNNPGTVDNNPTTATGKTNHQTGTVDMSNDQSDTVDMSNDWTTATEEKNLTDTHCIQDSEDSEVREGSDNSDEPLSDDEIDVDMFEDAITSGCTCGAVNRAHKKTCPMNPKLLYQQHTIKPLFKPGDFVCLHDGALKDKHICCRVIEHMSKTVATLYRLRCTTGVLQGLYQEVDLTESTSPMPISLSKWRTTPTITLRVARKNPCNLQQCTCDRSVTSSAMIDLTEALMEDSQRTDKVWVENSLYILHESDHNIIKSNDWLNDKIIRASQELLK